MESVSLKHHHLLFLGLFILSLGACDSETPSTTAVPDAEMTSPCARGCEVDSDGHQCCADTFGAEFFCSSSLRCVEMAFCETDMETDLCCQPGTGGDLLCEERLGAGSHCEADVDTGRCSSVSAQCPTCTLDNDGHTCCQEAIGPNAFCGGDGRCLEAQACREDNIACCIPGAAGDAHCLETFGETSECQLIGQGARCSMPAVPPCAGCIPDNEGHLCCQEALGNLAYCSLEQICRQTSGCASVECCVPGETGDAYCTEQYGATSSCAIVDGDGRCSQP